LGWLRVVRVVVVGGHCEKISGLWGIIKNSMVECVGHQRRAVYLIILIRLPSKMFKVPAIGPLASSISEAEALIGHGNIFLSVVEEIRERRYILTPEL
jgi:hypothetical protein